MTLQYDVHICIFKIFYVINLYSLIIVMLCYLKMYIKKVCNSDLIAF